MLGKLKNFSSYFKIFFVILLFTAVSGCNGIPNNNDPVINFFSASPPSITSGDSATLSWSVNNATLIFINQGIGTVTGTSITVSPTTTTTYTLTASSGVGISIANVIITVGTGMHEAINLVVNEILPGIPEIQFGEHYVCLKLNSSLMPGTLIEEDSPTTTKASVKLILEKEMNFFYLDLAPQSFYAHPVKYILVDKLGDYQIYDAEWWPKIGNEIPEVITEDIPDKEDIIDSNINFIKPVGELVNFQFSSIYSQNKEGFIIIQGLMPYECLFNCANNTYTNGLNFFNAYKNGLSRVEGLVQADSTMVFDTIDYMASEGRGVITIYIIAHGEIDSIKLGGQYFTSAQFYNKMAEYPAITFNLILGSCHSGSFVNDLWNLNNVYVVTTACAEDEGTRKDIDFMGVYDETGIDVNKYDVGSEWTSSLIEAMEIIVNDPNKMAMIQKWAGDDPVTSELICRASFGALGYLPELGMTTDYDFSHYKDLTSPCHYCIWETVY